MTFLVAETTGSRDASEARAVLRAVLRSESSRLGGQEVATGGDEGDARARFAAVFPGTRSAVACAVAIQRALAAHATALPVRIGLHTGDAEPDARHPGEFRGPALEQAVRVAAAADAQGGQIVASETTAALVRHGAGEDVRLVDLGEFRPEGAPYPERLFRVEYLSEEPRASTPPPQVPTRPTGNVPIQFTRFSGSLPKKRVNWIGTLPVGRVGTCGGGVDARGSSNRCSTRKRRSG